VHILVLLKGLGVCGGVGWSQGWVVHLDVRSASWDMGAGD
jgi:hypothetical protein